MTASDNRPSASGFSAAVVGPKTAPPGHWQDRSQDKGQNRDPSPDMDLPHGMSDGTDPQVYETSPLGVQGKDVS